MGKKKYKKKTLGDKIGDVFKRIRKGFDWRVAMILLVAALLFVGLDIYANRPAAKRNPNRDDAMQVYFTHVGRALSSNRMLYRNEPLPVNHAYDGVEHKMMEYESVRVTAVLEEADVRQNPDVENVWTGTQLLRGTVLTGRHKGRSFDFVNPMSKMFSKYSTAGTRLLCLISTDYNRSGPDGRPEVRVEIMNYDRSIYLYIFVGLFLLVTCLIGGKVGARSVIGLIVTIAFILRILVPLLTKRGWEPVASTVLMCIYTTIVSFVLLDGVQKKAMSATVGTLAGVFFAALLAYIAGKLCHIDGLQYNMSETDTLVQAQYQGIPIILRGLFVSGIMISALGAVNDVGMTIASSIHELRAVNRGLTWKQLFRSGMNIGRDAIATMTNTLILAFTGGALVHFVLIQIYQWPFASIINNDFIVGELISGLAGSIGIIMAVPFTAIVAALLTAGGKAAPQKGAHKPPARKKA
ncbi:MAG: YibE/F family protein [Clostridiales bacterium]|nr:YibE/F family protein [Clostridiales bacterium]